MGTQQPHMRKIVTDIKKGICDFEVLDLTGGLINSIIKNNMLRTKYETLTALAIIDMRAREFSQERIDPFVWGLRDISLFGAGEVIHRYQSEYERNFIPKLVDSSAVLSNNDENERFVSGERDW